MSEHRTEASGTLIPNNKNGRYANCTGISGTLLRILEPAANALSTFCKWLSAGGMIVFMGIVILTFLDVFLRYFFNRPLPGTYEVTEMLMALVVFSAIAYGQWNKSHVIMDVITGSLNENNKNTLGAVTSLWSLAVCALSIYATARYALIVKSTTGLLGIPYAPFVWFVVFGFVTMALSFVWDFLVQFHNVAKLGTVRIIIVWAAGIIPVLIAWYLGTHRLIGVSSVAIGSIGIVVMFLLFLSGMPVALALMATGFMFSGSIRGLTATLNFYGKAAFSTSASYTWSPLMFFMLMGYFCFYGNLGKDLYECAKKWLGHCRGGLAQGSVCACTAFGAVVGDSLSGTIAMSAIALPEMRSAGYDDKLAVGTLACSGTIGCLIPPSAYFILYGVLAEQSIADLFMAGVIPGILCMFLYCLTVWFMVWRNPALAPRVEKTPIGERMRSLTSALPILLLFILVIGGIYAGIFTPTEGGAIGSVGTLIIALALRRLTIKKFMESLNDASKFITMSFTVLTGATILGYLMTLSRIPTLLAEGIGAMGMPGWLTMVAIIIVLLFLGCFVPAMPLLLVCVPIFVPIAHLFHWDLIWFGVLMVLMMNMASITPPFGINLFVMKSVAEIPLGTMFRAAVPFVIGLAFVIAIIIAFPPLSAWLPAILH